MQNNYDTCHVWLIYFVNKQHSFDNKRDNYVNTWLWIMHVDINMLQVDFFHVNIQYNYVAWKVAKLKIKFNITLSQKSNIKTMYNVHVREVL